MEFIPVFLLAFSGGFLANRLRLPAGPLLGALIVTALLTLYVTPVTYIYEVKFLARVASGVMIGLRVRREDAKMLKTVWKPVLVLCVSMILYSTTLALALAHFTEIDLTTALFACVPGGLADISLMAEEYDANMAQVALVQLMRLVTLMFVYPFLANTLAKKEELKKNSPESTKNDTNIKKNPNKTKGISLKLEKLPPITDADMTQGVYTFVFAGFGALIFSNLGIPAGELLGAMTVTLFRKLKLQQGYFYAPARFAVQVVVGIMIGSTITPEALEGLASNFGITILTVVFILLFGIFMGKIIQKVQGTDPLTALLAVAPGGVQEMVLMADSLGGNVSFVTTLQVFRLLVVFSVFPLWISFLLSVLA